MRLPDGPKAPKFIQLFQWIFNPLQYLEDCSKTYGDVFTTRWGSSNSHFEKNQRKFSYLNRELVSKHDFLTDNYHPTLKIDKFSEICP